MKRVGERKVNSFKIHHNDILEELIKAYFLIEDALFIRGVDRRKGENRFDFKSSSKPYLTQ